MHCHLSLCLCWRLINPAQASLHFNLNKKDKSFITLLTRNFSCLFFHHFPENLSKPNCHSAYRYLSINKNVQSDSHSTSKMLKDLQTLLSGVTI
jgi:hypothetical protein